VDISVNSSSLIIIFISLVVSISIHEMMHAFAGYALGDTTAQEHGRLSLNPLRHIDPFLTILLPLITLIVFQVPFLAAKPVPFDPSRVRFGDYGAGLVALTGPLTNFVLACLAGLLMAITGPNLIIGLFGQINVVLFVFNMIPIPPLDGSRVLYAVAPEGVQAFMNQIEQFGFIIIFALILAVPGFNPLLSNVDQAVVQFLHLTV
jgi:Zn-dependent protease